MQTWDTTVAASAQAYANTCPSGHSGTSYGENLAFGWPTEDIPTAVGDWVSEGTSFTYSTSNSNTCSDICGHYTQIIWATSVSFGCGRASCPSLAGKGQGEVTVCQYSVIVFVFFWQSSFRFFHDLLLLLNKLFVLI